MWFKIIFVIWCVWLTLENQCKWIIKRESRNVPQIWGSSHHSITWISTVQKAICPFNITTAQLYSWNLYWPVSYLKDIYPHPKKSRCHGEVRAWDRSTMNMLYKRYAQFTASRSIKLGRSSIHVCSHIHTWESQLLRMSHIH